MGREISTEAEVSALYETTEGGVGVGVGGSSYTGVSTSGHLESDDDDRDVTEEIFRPLQVLRRQHRALQRDCSTSYILERARSYIPAFEWLPRYKPRTDLLPDVLAGVMVAVVCIPQGVAYASLAGLPPITGLYTCLVPALVYTFLGGSPCTHMGPFAVMALLIATSLQQVAPTGAPMDYLVDLSFVFSILIGLVLILMSVLRLGFAVSFLADCVLSAYNCAAAFIILTSQLKAFFGLTGMPSGLSFLDTWIWLLGHMDRVNVCSLLLGIFSVALLLSIDELNARLKLKVPVPSQLVAVVFGILVAYAGSLDTAYGLRVVGDIPSGLPAFRIPGFGTYVTEDGKSLTIMSLTNLQLFMQPSCMLALIAYITSISTAKGFATKHNEDRQKAREKAEAAAAAAPSTGAISSEVVAEDEPPQEIDANQELFALGVANLLGGMVSSFPSAASLSRSALIYNAGVKSSLHNVFSVIILIFVLLFLTPLLYYLPQTVLAAVVFTALKGLILQIHEGKRLYYLRKQDFLMWVGTFVSTLLFDTQVGIAVGLVISLAMLIKQTSRPPVATLGRLEQTDLYRNIKRCPQAQTVRGVLIFRFDAPLHFANKDFFRAQLQRHLAKAQEREWRKICPHDSNAISPHATSISFGGRLRQIGTGVKKVGVHAKKFVGHVGGHLKRKILRKRKNTIYDIDNMRAKDAQNLANSTRTYDVASDGTLNVPQRRDNALFDSDGEHVPNHLAGSGIEDSPTLSAMTAPSGNTSADESAQLSTLPGESEPVVELTRADCKVEWIILDCSSLIDMDDAALKMLIALPQQFGVSLVFASLTAPVRDLLQKTQFFENGKSPNNAANGAGARKPGMERPFTTVHQAMKYILKLQHEREAAVASSSMTEGLTSNEPTEPTSTSITIDEVNAVNQETAVQLAQAVAHAQQQQQQQHQHHGSETVTLTVNQPNAE